MTAFAQTIRPMPADSTHRSSTVHQPRRPLGCCAHRRVGSSPCNSANAARPYQAIAHAVVPQFGAACPKGYSRRDAHTDVVITMQALRRETDDAAGQVRAMTGTLRRSHVGGLRSGQVWRCQAVARRAQPDGKGEVMRWTGRFPPRRSPRRTQPSGQPQPSRGGL